MNPLAVALVISVLANLFLGSAYLGQRDTATVAVVQQHQATGAATACSQGTEALVTKAEERKVKAAPRREQAKKAAEVHERRADVILATPPAAPADDCKSAQARIDTWWEARSK